MTIPTRADHALHPTQYPICGKCGAVWRQRGNRTGHCGKCHETFEGIKMFDRHQHINADGSVTCIDPADIELGAAKTHLTFTDGVWAGPRMDEETIKRRFGLGVDNSATPTPNVALSDAAAVNRPADA